MNNTTIHQTIQVKTTTIISKNINNQNLKNILNYNLNITITKSKLIKTTLIITKKFNKITITTHTFQLLTSHTKQKTSINKTTQIRTNIMHPKIIIPLTTNSSTKNTNNNPTNLLKIKIPIQIIHNPHFNIINKINNLPSTPTPLKSKSQTHILSIQIKNNNKIIIPRTNIKLIKK